MPSFRAAGGTSLGGDILRPFRTSFSRSAYFTDVIFFILCPIPTVANSTLVKILLPQHGDRPMANAGCLSGSRCRVSFLVPMPSNFMNFDDIGTRKDTLEDTLHRAPEGHFAEAVVS